jgi:large subunit ribosomal protein L33
MLVGANQVASTFRELLTCKGPRVIFLIGLNSYTWVKNMSNKLILACSQCGSRNYSVPGKRSQSDRLELKKFCVKCNMHTTHKETK